MKYDCETKAQAYAGSGIRDYWVLDMQEGQLHIFREPSPNGYQTEEIVRGAIAVSPLAFPQVELTLDQMLQL